jgi:hypothetical protein
MNKRILQIIREEIADYGGYTPDWANNEPSIADKYYEKMITTPSAPPAEDFEIDAEKFGYVTKMFDKELPKPVPVFKNPKNLNGFDAYARGILLSNGDFYLGKNDKAMHENILEILSEKGIVPKNKTYQYFREYPIEFIAVQRASTANKFVPSSAYDYTPDYYEKTFYMANEKYPYEFKSFMMEEQLDPNWLMSYTPQGYDPGIVYESNVKKR